MCHEAGTTSEAESLWSFELMFHPEMLINASLTLVMKIYCFCHEFETKQCRYLGYKKKKKKNFRDLLKEETENFRLAKKGKV